MAKKDTGPNTTPFFFTELDPAALFNPAQAFSKMSQWFEPAPDLFKKGNGTQAPFPFPDFSKSALDWYAMATDQFQAAFDEYWKMMGLVPKNEHTRLVEKYNAIRRQLEEEKKKQDKIQKKSKEEAASLKEAKGALTKATARIKELEGELKADKAAKPKTTAKKKS